MGGMLAGMMLLGFAGVIVVMPSSTSVESSGNFLERRLQGFGYITTSKAPSSFDSSDSSSSGSIFEPSKSSESGSLQSSELQVSSASAWKQMAGSVGSTMLWLTASLMIQVVFGCLYSRVVTAPIVDSGMLDQMMANSQDAGRDDFANSMFGCFNDKWGCFQGLCCPMVRIAHTNAVSGVCPFWESLWCYCCCAWLTLNIGPFCLLMWWRLRLKNIMKVEENPINDFCLTMLCPQLSLCQMSSAVDSAMGYQITGCCEYTPFSYGGPMEQMQ